jgi:hypothetical protein
MKKQLVVHPFLFGLYWVLVIYSINVTMVSPKETLLPIVVVLAATSMIMLLAWTVLRDLRKAGLLATIVLMLCFSYGRVVNLIRGDGDAGKNFPTVLDDVGIIVLVVWILLFSISVYFTWSTRSTVRKFTTILNIVAPVMLIMPTVNIMIKEVGVHGRYTPASGMTEIDLTIPETPRDIYYIILDRYANSSTLKEQYDFDNSEFMDYLSSKGFYVVSESRSNYQSTSHSLASSLNMDYLDRLIEVSATETDLDPLTAMFKDHQVRRLLKSMGYEYVHLGDWWEPTRENKYADLNINYGGRLPEFSRAVLRTTVLTPVLTALGILEDPRIGQWEREMYKFQRMARIPDIEGPTFVFAHFLLPHPPYVFDRDGSFLKPEQAAGISLKTRYVDQLVATNAQVMALIDALLANSSISPIIILQADEGPIPGALWSSWNASEATDEELKEKTGILNAYYLPEVDSDTLYPSITPVNSFRLVFNLYFGTNLELLPDRTYVYYRGQPYRFYDVTERLDQSTT